MIEICHLFDETADWQHRVGASHLLDRLPRESYRATLATIDAESAGMLRRLPGTLRRVPRLGGLNLLAAPIVKQHLGEGTDVIHAWGPSAGLAAASDERRPLVVELFDPAVAVRGAKLLRSIARTTGFAIVCSTQWIRRRLVENGVPDRVCVVIRPGIDFGLIQKVRRSSLRADLGIEETDFVIVIDPEGGGGHGAFEAFWAGTLLNHLDGHYKVIVPDQGRQVERISRFAAGLPTASGLIVPGRSDLVEELVCIGDVLIVPGPESVPVTSIAWAFGAGSAVIAAASYSVTELVVNKVNGLLYKHPPGKSPASRIVALVRDRDSQRKVKEAARGQAYEIFSLRRYVEQHMQLYANILAGRAPGESISDPASLSHTA